MSTANAIMPFEISTDLFEKTLRGVFGRFQTRDSYRLHYVLASMPFADIDQMLTAAEAISIADPQVTFAQLIQRDIDYDRVARMVSEYLEAGANRVIFFPPLLVSLLGIQDGLIVRKYESAVPKFNDKVYVQTWEQGFFQLILPLANMNTGHSISADGQSRSFYNFGAQLRYNPRLVKMVVIDGQHRLQALKKLRGNPIVDTIEIPICVVFPPDAVAGRDEEITTDLRELFVTINQEATKVSGHFITLLDDKSLSSAAIRILGDSWKGQIDETGYTPLQLLEWNQRHAKLAFQVTRDQAITTVSILGDALEKHVFDSEAGGRTFTLLNLGAIKSDLEQEDGAVPAEEISNSTFHPRQLSLLEERIGAYLVPALDTLMRQPRPYRQHEAKLKKAYSWLNQQIATGSVAASSFKVDVLQQFRDIHETDPENVQAFAEVFASHVERTADDARFFYNVFEQGLVRCWAQLASDLIRFEVSPPKAASILVAALDELCFAEGTKLFATDRPYVRRVLFSGERVLLNKGARDGWLELILASLAHPKSLERLTATAKAADSSLDDEVIGQIARSVRQQAIKAAQSYLERYGDAIRNDLEQNYFERDLAEDLIRRLRRLDLSGEPADREAFDAEIQKQAETRKLTALEILSNVLKVPKRDLLVRAN